MQDWQCFSVFPQSQSAKSGDDVEKVDMTLDGQIVAICRRGKTRQKIPILDLPLPTPAPAGVEWIVAYRHWRRGTW